MILKMNDIQLFYMLFASQLSNHKLYHESIGQFFTLRIEANYELVKFKK